MINTLRKLYVNAQGLMAEDSGQDLIEYSLVVALIAFAAVAGMSTVATGINNAFSTISSKLASALA